LAFSKCILKILSTEAFD